LRPSLARSCSDHDTKIASWLAQVGTILRTAFRLRKFVFTFLNVLWGLAPGAMLLQSFLYAFGCFSVMAFFFVFHKAQQLCRELAHENIPRQTDHS
jgi:hypothetical protein